MAKKVRKKPEEEAPSFEFPEFDEAGFVSKETELTGGLLVASILTVLLGLVSWGVTQAGLPWWLAFVIGVLGLAGSPSFISRLRPHSDVYTKGDWASMIALEFFGWLALWFVLVNIT